MNKELLENFIKENTRFEKIVFSKDGVHLDSIFIIDFDSLEVQFLIERNELEFSLLEELRMICLEIHDLKTLETYEYWDKLYDFSPVDRFWWKTFIDKPSFVFSLYKFNYFVHRKGNVNEQVPLEEIQQNGYLDYVISNGFKLKFL